MQESLALGRVTGRVLVYDLQAVLKLADELQEWTYVNEEAKLYRCGIQQACVAFALQSLSDLTSEEQRKEGCLIQPGTKHSHMDQADAVESAGLRQSGSTSRGLRMMLLLRPEPRSGPGRGLA